MAKKRSLKGLIKKKVRLSAEVRDALRALGSVGGKTSASRMTQEERKARGKRAVGVRWERHRAKVRAAKKAKAAKQADSAVTASPEPT